MEYGKSAITKELTAESIKDRIYTIRGMQVMLDSDLAKLYGVETKVLNQAVKRNIKRFPSKYMFRLDSNECMILKSQFVTSNTGTERGGRRNIPSVFTEQGVSMLSAVLHSDTAIDVSIRIMDAFVEMRHYLADNALVFNRLDRIELKQLEADENFRQIFKQLEQPKENKAVLFFKGHQ